MIGQRDIDGKEHAITQKISSGPYKPDTWPILWRFMQLEAQLE